MKAATIKQIKQGEFFKLQPTDSAPVWVRGHYCREDKTFEAYTPTEALKATLQANWHKVLLATILAVSLAGLLAK